MIEPLGTNSLGTGLFCDSMVLGGLSRLIVPGGAPCAARRKFWVDGQKIDLPRYD